MMKKRLAIVVSHPIQYHIVIWRELSKHKDLDVEVLYCSRQGLEKYYDKDFNLELKWDIDLLSGYRSRFFENSKWSRKGGFFKYINPKLIRHIQKEKYDYVYFHGINHFTHVLSLISAKLRGGTVIVRNIAHLLNVDKKRIRFKLRKVIFTFLYRLIDYALYIGKNNKEYYKEFGVKEEKLLHVPHVVDNTYFKSRIPNLNEKEIRSKFQIKPDNLVLLFCAKFYYKKQPLLLMEAYQRSKVNNVSLLMIGDGLMMEQLKEKKNELLLENDKEIILTGFLNQSELPSAYFISDVIVLPSLSETWGLVINEAINFDCAAIVSDKVGCAPEVLEKNAGVVFQYQNIAQLTECIEELFTQADKLNFYKQNAKSLIKSWDVKNFSEIFDVILKDKFQC